MRATSLYFKEDKMAKIENITKVKVTMEIEAKDIEDFPKFITTIEKGVIKFSEETKTNVLKVKVKEH